MPAPKRRTRRDLTVTALLATVVVVVVAALWWTSDVRRSVLVTGPPQAADDAPAPLTAPPAVLRELWRADNPVAPVPLVRGGTVVTGTGGPGGEVAGRELRSGVVRWSYRRDLPLCTVADTFARVIAVYQRGVFCGEVTSLDWSDGRRGPQRTGPVRAPTRLVGDTAHVAAIGQRYLEVWRTDLVRTLVYGRLPTPVKPKAQPRPDCTHGSVALHGGRLALIEWCPGERAARLTVQRSHPQEPNQPEVDFSVLLPGAHAQVVSVGMDRVVVAVPDPARLLVFDTAGTRVAEHPLAVPDVDLRGNPPRNVATTTTTPGGLSWFTGSVAVVLEARTYRPRWAWPGSLGSGTMIAGRLLLPTADALVVVDALTGQQVAEVAVDRDGYSGPVGLASSGDVVLEQRGDTLVALRAVT